MQTTTPVNPELMLAAANTAEPGRKWRIGKTADNEFSIVDAELVNGCFSVFDPLTSDADAMKLERALKKEGWKFWEESGQFCADSIGTKNYFPIKDESDTLLLLKCVSATTGLPMGVK